MCDLKDVVEVDQKFSSAVEDDRLAKKLKQLDFETPTTNSSSLGIKRKIQEIGDNVVLEDNTTDQKDKKIKPHTLSLSSTATSMTDDQSTSETIELQSNIQKEALIHEPSFDHLDLKLPNTPSSFPFTTSSISTSVSSSPGFSLVAYLNEERDRLIREMSAEYMTWKQAQQGRVTSVDVVIEDKFLKIYICLPDINVMPSYIPESWKKYPIEYLEYKLPSSLYR